jgi:hypothetical protein
MQKKTKSGRRIFLEFAWQCAFYRLTVEKDMNKTDYDVQEMLIENGDSPPIRLLKKCYPDAAKDYREACKTKGYKANFSRKSVIYYWGYCHKGETPTEVATVVMRDDRGGILVSCNGETTIVFNPFNLELETGKEFFIHNGAMVIAKEEP